MNKIGAIAAGLSVLALSAGPALAANGSHTPRCNLQSIGN